MAYKALYRSYRPTTFNEVIGQKHVIQTLKNAIKEKRTSHAYVFSGLRGIGKTTIARILAKAVNCLDPIDGEPCNKCKNCLAIINNQTTDIVELDAASNNGVDEIRNILDKVNYLPSSLSKKVYIIDEVHMLSTAAFNALLKTLEEPPAYVMFILATTEPHKIPMTILSRCQRFDFKQLTVDEIEQELKIVCEKENISIDQNAMSCIAEAAEGGMRDALGILDQASVFADGLIKVEDINSITGRISDQNLIDLLKAFNENNGSKAISIVNDLLGMGKEVSRMVTCIIQFCRDILLYKSINNVPSNKNIYFSDDFKKLCNETENNRLFYYIDVLVDVQNKIRYTNSQKIYLEVGIMKIVNSAATDINILERIQNIELQLQDGQTSNSTTFGENNFMQRLSVVEAKIKKMNQEFEKADLINFEESIKGKINLLEDVVSNNSSTGENKINYTDVLTRVDQLEDKINSSINEQQTTGNENGSLEKYQGVLNALVEDVENLKNTNKEENSASPDVNDDIIIELMDKVDALENKLDKSFSEKQLTSGEEISALKEKLNNISIELNDLKQQPSSLEPVISIDNTNKDEQSIATFAELVKPIQDKIEQLEIKINENYCDKETVSQSDSTDSTKYQELTNQMSQLLERISLVEEKQKETKLGNLQKDDSSLINNQADPTSECEIEKLKTNYYILSNTLKLLIEKVDSIFSNKDLTNLNTKVIEFESNFKEINIKISMLESTSLKDGALIPITEKINEISNDINSLKTVIKQKQEELNSNPAPILPKQEEKVVERAKIEKVETDKVVQKTTNKNNVDSSQTIPFIKEDPNDITKKVYDVKIVEKILHQARLPESREAKTKLIENWQKLDDKVGGLLAPTARLLSTGLLVANGADNLLIVYPNAALCNHLMDPKTHAEVKEILNITFGKPYDFIALPDDTWKEKRLEYHGQYETGTKYPSLTPINNPQLKVYQNKKSVLSERQRTIEKAKDFFGDDFE